MAAYVKYLIIWINIGSAVLGGYRNYLMNNNCGSVIDFDTENIFGAILTYNLTSPAPSQGTCTVGVVRSTSMFSHLHFYVSDFRSDVTNCSHYSLAVRYGNTQNTTVPHSDIPHVCDSSLNQVSYTSWRAYLEFSFSWNSTTPKSYLVIVVNAYSPDKCLDDDDKSQTECKNDRCIPSSLKCANLNPCGDNSDCKDDDNELSYTVRILYTIGSVIVFIFLLTIIYNMCFKNKWAELCRSEDGCCCKDLCACVCISVRDCFGACFSSIKRSGSKLKGCCCQVCCKNTVSFDRSGTDMATVTAPYTDNTVAPPPYNLRSFSPPPTYSVAMRNAPPPEYSEVFSISMDPSADPPPNYDEATREGRNSSRRS